MVKMKGGQPMNGSPMPHGSAGNTVYTRLKQQILCLELPPGTILSEQDTSAVFQTSRTPVRESFVRLAQEGLVNVLPQRGTHVSLIDSELVEEGRFMREQIEKAVIRLACDDFPEEMLNHLDRNLVLQQRSMEKWDYQRMFDLDEAFHRALFEGCRKLQTWTVIQQMNSHLNRSRMLWLTTDKHWTPLVEQHKEMVEAIRERDPDHAESVMKKHMNLNISDMTSLKVAYPNYIK
jgi:DNA-binding GntR family transcriptional regulator